VPLEQIGREVDRLREALAARATIEKVIEGKVPIMVGGQMNQTFISVSPHEDDLDRLMRDQPDKIPEIMALIDQMDALMGPKQVGSGPGTAAPDERAAATG